MSFSEKQNVPYIVHVTVNVLNSEYNLIDVPMTAFLAYLFISSKGFCLNLQEGLHTWYLTIFLHLFGN